MHATLVAAANYPWIVDEINENDTVEEVIAAYQAAKARFISLGVDEKLIKVGGTLADWH